MASDLLDSGAGLECVLAEEMPGTDLELDFFNTDRDLQMYCMIIELKLDATMLYAR